MPRKPNTKEFDQYLEKIVTDAENQAGIFMPDSEKYNLVNLLGAALSDFAAELKKDKASIEAGKKAESFSKAIETLLTTEPPIKNNKKARNSISQALATLQELGPFLDDNLDDLLSFSQRQTNNVREAIEQGLPALSDELDLGLDLSLLKEDEEAQEEAQDEQDGPQNDEIIQENANDNVIRENVENVINQNNPPEQVNQENVANNENNQPGQVNQENNVNNGNNQNGNQQDAQANPQAAPAHYSYEQFLQVKENAKQQHLYEYEFSNLAEQMTHHTSYMMSSVSFYDPTNSIKDHLQAKYPGYADAIATVMSNNVSKEAYDNAMRTLADFPAFLAAVHYGESNFRRLFDVGRQNLTYVGPDDLADQLAFFGKLTGLPMNKIPQVERAYQRVKDMPLPEPQAPQEEQVNQQNAPNLNQENVQQNVNANPEQNVQQNENVIIENANEDLPQNQNVQNELNQEVPVPQPEPQPVADVPAPAPAPLNKNELLEPAARLKTHFLRLAHLIGANAGPNTLTGEMRIKLPQFANAIATLGTDGQPAESYQNATSILQQQLHPLLVRIGSTGTLGYEYLSTHCGKINGGCPNEQSLKDDLRALNGALNLGLENLEQEVAQHRSLRGRKMDQLIYASKPLNPQSLNHFSAEPNQRTALEHLNALYASLKAYDDAHPQAPQFTQILEHLNTVRQCVVGTIDEKHGNSLMRQGVIANDLLAAARLLQADDQTITEGLDKPTVLAQLHRAAAAMRINPNNFVPEDVYNQVVSRENDYIARRDEAEQQEAQRRRNLRERFGNDYEQRYSYERSLFNAIDRVTNRNFDGFTPAAKMNGMIGMFALAQILAESPHSGEVSLDQDRVSRTANALAANPVFTNLISQNMAQIRDAARNNSWDGIMKFIQNKELEMEELPESLPAVFLPEAIDLTHDRIEKAKLAEFRQKPLPDKVHTLAQILAAREVVGSTRGDKHTLERGLGKKFFARTRELEQSKTFRDFVQRNEEHILRSLRGRTHGGAMEDLFKSYVLTRPNIPDDIPDRFMPTALERIEALQKAIRSNSFRNLELREKKGYYAELMATRLAVNSVRNSKSSLNFQLNGEALAKAREAILSDPDMVRALGDRGMFDAAKTGHGGQMEEIAGKYNCKDVLKENMPPRYQPTVKEWIQSQLRKLSDANLLENDADRQAAAAKIFVALEAYGDNQNVRIGQNGPSAGDLNTRAQNLANDQIYKSICMMGGLASSLDLSTARNPLRTLKNTFTTSLNAAQNKPLGGSFTQLSPARNQAQNQQPAAPVAVDQARNFEKNKALLAGHMQGIQNNQRADFWRNLNARTVKRALAEIAVCAVPNQIGVLTEETLQQKSTALMESREWQNLFAQKSTEQLQELVTNAENPQQCIQAINDALHAAQPQAPQAQQNQPVAQELQNDVQANNQPIQLNNP